MVLNLGETKSFKLPLMLKAMDFIYEGNGLRLERQRGGVLCLNVNSGRRKDAFAAIPLGPAKELNAVGMNIKVHSNSRILFWVGNVRFVIDYMYHPEPLESPPSSVTPRMTWTHGRNPWPAE